MTQQVLVSVASLSQDPLLIRCKEIRDAMSGNPLFPTPAPSIEDYGILINNFEAKLLDSSTGLKQAIAEKNTFMAELMFQTKRLGNYVNSVAAGNVNALVSSGFPLRPLPQPRVIEAPTGLAILQGKTPGSLISKVDAVKGAIGYEHMIASHPLTATSVWTIVGSSRCKNTFEDLEEGKLYWVQVVALGSNEQRTYSETISSFVNQRTLANAA